MLEQLKSKQLLTLYQLKEKLQVRKESDSLKEICSYIESNFKELEKCAVITTRSAIDWEINIKTIEPAFLWQEKLVAIYRIYATTLGVLDARYVDYVMDAKFYSQFDKKDEIIKISERIDEIIKYREKIVEDYLNLTTSSDPKLIKEVLKAKPSCELFNKLYEDMVNNHYQLSLQGEVISAYMKGYNASIRFQPEKVIEFYDKRKAKFDLKMSKMNFDIDKVKKLKLKKEIDY